MPAVVGGSGVTAGSNVAGPLRSSSNDRECAGVASQAHVTLNATRAETVVPTAMTKLSKSVRSLKSCLITQDGDLKQLFQKASVLEILAEKSRSPAVNRRTASSGGRHQG